MLNLHDLFSGTKFNSHPHACIIYDDLLHYRKVASYFIFDGLNKNEKCIMAVDEYHPDSIREDFEQADVDIDSYLKDGKLTLIDVKSSYSGNGGFDPDSTIKIWQKECNKAISEGYNGLRIVGEATFSLGNPDLVDKLIYYENIMNEVLFNKFPFKSLCVYNRKLYPLEIIKTAISAHPVLFYNDKLFRENIHYIPPEIYFKGKNTRDEVDIMLKNIQRNNDNLVALKDSETKFRMMFDKAPLSYQSLDEKGNFLEINENWLKVLGYKKEEIIGRNFSEFLHPDWKDHFKENFPRFKAVGEVLGVEFEMMKKDGSFILVSFYGKIGKNSNNSFSRTHCIFQDITERRKSENKMIEYTQNLETIFNSTPNILMQVDKYGRIKKINQKGAAIDDRRSDELSGILCGNFFNCVNAVDDNICGQGTKCVDCVVKRMIDSTFETGNSQSEKEGQITVFSDHKKIKRFFLISTAIIQIDSEKYVLLSMIDVTQLNHLEKRLQQSQKMEAIGNLAGGVAHDFNNLLFPIVGLSEMMLDDFPPGSLEHQNLNEIFQAGKRGKELVQQILSFSRQSEHQQIPVHIQKILKEVLKLCRVSIPADIPITPDIQVDCAPVMADPTQIHQIAMNLITNAYHAVEPSGGTITVQLKEASFSHEDYPAVQLAPGRYTVLTVTDTGTGIDPVVMNKIFDPYFTTKKNGKGTGLGLSTVYGIVKAHGGDIKVYSEMGKGSCFHVYLPVLEKSADVASEKQQQPLPTGTEHILLVDDEAPIVHMEKMMLERLGYQITSFTSSVDALTAFKTDPSCFDLIITDMNMPNLNGMKLAEKLTAISPDIPVIICTGFSERINEENAATKGVRGFLMKPLVMKDITQKVREILDDSRN